MFDIEDLSVSLSEGGALSDLSKAVVQRPQTCSAEWERRLGDFYRQVEIANDARSKEDSIALREGELSVLHTQVQQQNTDRKQRREEVAVVTANRRRRQRAEIDKNKEAIKAKLQEADKLREEEFEKRRQRLQDRQKQVARQKEIQSSQRSFTVRHSVLDKTCREIDVQRAKAKTQLEVKTKTDLKREEAEGWSRQMECRRLVKNEDQRARTWDDRQRLVYLLKQRQELDQQQSEAKKASVRARNVFNRYIGDVKEDIESSAVSQQPEWDGWEEYANSLAAFRDLADDVLRTRLQLQSSDWQSQELIIDDHVNSSAAPEQPDVLFPAEPRVLVALGIDTAAAACGPDRQPDRMPSLGVAQEFLGGGGQALGASTVVPVPARSEPLPPSLQGVGSALPGVKEVEGSACGGPFSARSPFTSRVSPEVAARGLGERSIRDMQSLAALRMIRRTGPLVR